MKLTDLPIHCTNLIYNYLFMRDIRKISLTCKQFHQTKLYHKRALIVNMNCFTLDTLFDKYKLIGNLKKLVMV